MDCLYSSAFISNNKNIIFAKKGKAFSFQPYPVQFAGARFEENAPAAAGNTRRDSLLPGGHSEDRLEAGPPKSYTTTHLRI
jgi:hypothetical protein